MYDNEKLFDKCYDHLLKNEGGYANDPDDSGGETYKGIAREYHHYWKGWELIDQYKKNSNGFPQNAYMDEELDKMVRAFYKRFFWDKMNLALIVNENSVLQLFDMAVNSGIWQAVKLAQIACEMTHIDGKLGPKTAFEINSEGHNFFKKYVNQRIKFYNLLVQRNPKNNKFLNGWCKRAKNTKF